MEASQDISRQTSEPPSRRLSRRASFDAALLLAMLVVAIAGGSLALLAESVRSLLISMAAAWSSVLRAGTRDPARRRYEFGIGKLEQAGDLAIALLLVAAGLWFAAWAIGALMAGRSGAQPFGLALAATLNAVHTMRVGALLLGRRGAGAADEQPTPGAPAPTGVPRLLSLLAVQAMLTTAALARDPAVALIADNLGAIFVGLLMTAAGVRMLFEALLDLIDHPLRTSDEAAIARVLLDEGIQPEELIGMRSRRAGRDLFVELTLDLVDAASLDDSRRRLARARQRLEDRFRGIDVAIRLHTPEQ